MLRISNVQVETLAGHAEEGSLTIVKS